MAWWSPGGSGRGEPMLTVTSCHRTDRIWTASRCAVLDATTLRRRGRPLPPRRSPERAAPRRGRRDRRARARRLQPPRGRPPRRVSHTAPAHHFGDVRGLLTSLADGGVRHAATDATDGCHGGRTTTRSSRSHGDRRGVRRARAVAPGALRGHVPARPRRRGRRSSAPDVRARGVRRPGAHGAARSIDAEGVDRPVDDAAWMCWSAMQGLVVIEDKLGMLAELRGDEPVSHERPRPPVHRPSSSPASASAVTFTARFTSRCAPCHSGSRSSG